jgi:hypothetical protein
MDMGLTWNLGPPARLYKLLESHTARGSGRDQHICCQVHVACTCQPSHLFAIFIQAGLCQAASQPASSMQQVPHARLQRCKLLGIP